MHVGHVDFKNQPDNDGRSASRSDKENARSARKIFQEATVDREITPETAVPLPSRYYNGCKLLYTYIKNRYSVFNIFSLFLFYNLFHIFLKIYTGYTDLYKARAWFALGHLAHVDKN